MRPSRKHKWRLRNEDCCAVPYFRQHAYHARGKQENKGRGGVTVAKKIRGVTFEENANNSMGLEFYNLSHRFGYQSPNWPYFEDVKIERIHYMAKSGVLS